MNRKRLFAIGLKGHVEIREATSIPKRRESRTTVPSTKRVLSDWGGYYGDTPIYKTVTQKVPITVVIYVGGKVIGTLKSEQFARLTSVAVRNGGMIELSADHSSSVLTALERG